MAYRAPIGRLSDAYRAPIGRLSYHYNIVSKSDITISGVYKSLSSPSDVYKGLDFVEFLVRDSHSQQYVRERNSFLHRVFNLP